MRNFYRSEPSERSLTPIPRRKGVKASGRKPSPSMKMLAAGHAESLNARGERVKLWCRSEPPDESGLSERVSPKRENSVPNGN